MPINDAEADLYSKYKELLPMANSLEKLEVLNGIFLSMREALRSLHVIEPCADDEMFHAALNQTSNPTSKHNVIEMHYDEHVSHMRAHAEARKANEGLSASDARISDHISMAHRLMHDAIHETTTDTKHEMYVVPDADLPPKVVPKKRTRKLGKQKKPEPVVTQKPEKDVPVSRQIGNRLHELRGTMDPQYIENATGIKANRIVGMENAEYPIVANYVLKLLDFYGASVEDRQWFDEKLGVAS